MKTQFYLFFFLSFFVANTATTQTLEDDRLALIAFYNATNGAGWTNNSGWIVPGTPGDNPCGWYGINCAGGRVSRIDIRSNNLTGTLPPEIGNLSELIYLDYLDNHIGGPIPSEIGNLHELDVWFANYNSHSGALPSEIGNLNKLSWLAIAQNNLSGIIPTEIGNLSEMEYLDLSSNGLTGTIPAEIGNLSQLRYFTINQNQLGGAMPSELGNLTNLQVFDYSGNSISGLIPAEFGNMSSLYRLAANYNNHSGSIPSDLGNLTNLGQLQYAANSLSGEIPVELSNLTNLELVDFSSNELSGLVPDFSASSNMGNLFINENRFTFNGMRENLFVPNYFYNDQAFIPIYQSGSQLYVNAGGIIANNTYEWHKIGTGLVATIVGDQHYVANQSGDYFAIVVNSELPQLVLISETATVICSAEICDGQDNNCDGVVDEGCVGDTDGDGILDDTDNCENIPNPSQTDSDCDGVGNACDLCPGGDDSQDSDNNGIPDCADWSSINAVPNNWLCGNNDKKVWVCHILPGNPSNQHNICVSPDAVPAHLSHGDYLGFCGATSCDENMLISPDGNSSPIAHAHIGLELFPNPAESEFQLVFDEAIPENSAVLIMDMAGRVVLKEPLVSGENAQSVTINTLPSGVYFIKVTENGLMLFVEKLVKQ